MAKVVAPRHALEVLDAAIQVSLCPSPCPQRILTLFVQMHNTQALHTGYPALALTHRVLEQQA